MIPFLKRIIEMLRGTQVLLGQEATKQMDIIDILRRLVHQSWI